MLVLGAIYYWGGSAGRQGERLGVRGDEAGTRAGEADVPVVQVSSMDFRSMP